MPAAAESGVGGTQKRRFVRNTGFSLLQQVVAMALGVVLVPFMLWQLGTERYGFWLTLQIFNIFGLLALADLGFQGAIVRYLVRFHAMGERESFRRLLATAFVLFAIIGAVCCIGVAVFAQTAFVDAFDIKPALADEMRTALTVYSLGLAIGFPALILKAFFASLQDVATLKIWETLDRMLFTLILFALLMFSDRLLHLVLAEQAVMLTLIGLFTYLAYRKGEGWFTLDLRKANRASLHGVTGLSGMVFTTGISNQVYIKAPEALIGAHLGPVALAYYQIATRIPRVFKSVQGALNAAVLPHVAGLDVDDEGSQQLRRRFALLGLRFNYLLFVPMACFVIVFARDILRLWVGEKYAFLSIFLAAYALWQLSSIVIGFGNATLTRTEHYRSLVWQNLAINALFLVALVVLLDRYGLAGAFVALLLSGVASAAVVLLASRKANGFGLREFVKNVVLGPVLLSGAIGTVLFGAAKLAQLEWGLVVGFAAAAVAGGLYLLALYRFVISAEERDMIANGIANRRAKT